MASKTYTIKQINTYNGSQDAQNKLNAYINGTVSDIGTVPVSEIRENAFKGCSSLTTFNSSSTITRIGSEAFKGCSALVSIDLSNAEYIGNEAFNGCSLLALSNRYLNATYIGEKAFYACASLTGYFSLRSDSVVASDAFAFSGITGANVSSGCYDYAFRNCRNLVSVDLPREFEYSPMGLFQECRALTTVTGARYLEEITTYMFYGCSSLTSIDIRNATNIGLEAFRNCSSLESITIGSGITSQLNSYLFAGCTSLTNITYLGTREQAAVVFGNLHSSVPATVIECSDGNLAL